MSKTIKRYLPPIGLRIIKSAVAIALCYVISFIRGNDGIVFYSMIAALWCMQVYVANTKKNAYQRIIGTIIGAVYGLVFLLIMRTLNLDDEVRQIADAVVISLMIILVLYTTVLINKKQASYFSCVVFLSIVVNHVGDANPYLFVWNRFLDTMIGIFVGVCVNLAGLPRGERKDVLFISGLDDTLLSGKNEELSDYSRIELNRMIDDGANFTVSTMRTPASLMEPLRDVRMKLPVIAMNGAVLYDIRENRYLKTYVISSSEANRVLSLVREKGLTCFSNVIVDDMLVIYYDELEDEVQKELLNKLRKSPYRNYVQRPRPESDYVVYFMMIYPDEVIEDFYEFLCANGIDKDLKIIKYASTDYPGYSYIKIYNKNASKENMVAYLKEMLYIDITITFGSIPGKYDVVVKPGGTNQVVHTLRELYEPVRIPKIFKKKEKADEF